MLLPGKRRYMIPGRLRNQQLRRAFRARSGRSHSHNSPSQKLFPSASARGSKPDLFYPRSTRSMGSDTFTLPQTEAQDVRKFQKEYLEMSKAGDKGTPHACFRWVYLLQFRCDSRPKLWLLTPAVTLDCVYCSFVWALVHSPDPAHVQRGLDLAQSMIKARDIDQQHLNDLVYLCAVVSISYCLTARPECWVQPSCCTLFIASILLCTGSIPKRQLSSFEGANC